MASSTTTAVKQSSGGLWSKWGTGSNLSFVSRKEQQQQQQQSSPEASTPAAQQEKSISRESIPEGFLTVEEVSKHDNPSDCWIVINDKVYDVSAFGKTHPGGPVIFTQAGRDATDSFKVFHSAKAWQFLQDLYIGDLYNAEPVSELVKDYRDLRTAFMRSQLFKSSKMYYVTKCVTNFAILAASLAVIAWSQTYLAVLCSSFLLALFWQQCGWLSHDFLHHQVTENRSLNTYFGGLFWGNFAQGYSVGWWKTKHNVHHAATNECDDKYQPIDPDIDTVPLLAWSKEILATVDDQFFRSIISVQHLLFFPLLFLARFSWLHSSWAHASNFEMPRYMRWAEKASLLGHYGASIGAAFYILPIPQAICWLFLSQLFCGALLSIVFVISHNGMDVYNDPRDFVTAQVTSTRNIEGNFFNDWFTGGLNRQIEHHLFPSLPRHNLAKVAPHVKALCAKHGLHYEELSLGTGVCRVFNRLVEVAYAAKV
ncbi:protein MpDES6 [Marchantia polymorpha subsp. ruderalis]|uniref:Cytochrome b5 heme-binding domain-containing protein n=2 Tax=Marchantia polymorpha TaxID=3197 RepID=A0AAF6BSZ9_MARPO|nr:delta6 fatty acid desaturase [Marchantia polymorpha]PTQ27779.1 hypothetical protein MARPO_0184s0017 [Marchantia polymorpha]BBN15133.1 hypothetical protein Mp_6g17330 [Marchantia polymorpha subsp. ruderalis]|eukprot:PTQ27779.1 hypothetical protein MARPO_0184s0017 [Marchantia polymorpha]